MYVLFLFQDIVIAGEKCFWNMYMKVMKKIGGTMSNRDLIQLCFLGIQGKILLLTLLPQL